MDKAKLQEYYDYINEKSDEYFIANSGKRKDTTTMNRVADTLREYSESFMDGDTYITCNNGLASGLFRHGFVETDINRSLHILGDLIKEAE